jgi:hypothetical protein
LFDQVGVFGIDNPQKVVLKAGVVLTKNGVDLVLFCQILDAFVESLDQGFSDLQVI